MANRYLRGLDKRPDRSRPPEGTFAAKREEALRAATNLGHRLVLEGVSPAEVAAVLNRPDRPIGEPVTAALSGRDEAGAGVFGHGLELLRRPARAIGGAIQESAALADAARGGTDLPRGTLPGQEPLPPYGERLRAVFRGAGRGIRGDAPMIDEALLEAMSPEQRVAHPTLARSTAFVGGLALDPVMYTGAAGGRVFGGALAGATGAALGQTPEAITAAVRLLPGVARQVRNIPVVAAATGAVGRTARGLFQRAGNTPPEYQAARNRFLRRRRGAEHLALEDVRDIAGRLTPDQEVQARRLIEADRVPEAIRGTGRRFRFSGNVAEERLNQVLEEASREQGAFFGTRSQMEKHIAREMGVPRRELQRLSMDDLMDLSQEIASQRKPEQIVREVAARRGYDLDRLFSEASQSPLERLRAMSERARLGRVAGVTEAHRALRRPDLSRAVDRLAEQGVDRQVAEAAVRAYRLTQHIVREYQKRGLHIDPREAYFPHIHDDLTVVARLRGYLNRVIKPSDRFAQRRTIEGTVDDINQMVARGELPPQYRVREDFGIPLAIRNMAAAQRLRTHDFLMETVDKFGKPLQKGQLVQDLLDDGMVAFDPKTGSYFIAGEVGKGMPDRLWALPTPVADDLRGFYKTMLTDEGLATLADIWRAVHRFWKASVTVVRPAFHANNLLGGIINGAIKGVTTPAPYMHAIGVLRRAGGALPVRTAGGAEVMVPYDQVRRLLMQEGVLDAGIAGSLFEARSLQEATRGLGQGRTLNPLEHLRRMGAAIENWMRSATFIDGLMKGKAPAEAAETAFAAHFDYSAEALTKAEQILKEVGVPFYVWLKNNSALHLREFLERPQLYAAYLRIRDQLSAPGREERPDYLRWAIPLDAELRGFPVVLNVQDPIMDVAELVESPGEKSQFAIGPAFREVLPMLSGRDAYGRPISEFPGQRVPFLGVQVSPYVPHIARRLLGAPGRLVEDVGVLRETAPRPDETPEEMDIRQARAAASLVRFLAPGVNTYSPEQEGLRQAAATRRSVENLRRLTEQMTGRPVRPLAELMAPAPRRPNRYMRPARGAR